MEAHVVLGGVGVLAAFGCGAAASASVAGRARRRTASLVGEGDVGSSRVAWLLRNGVGWTRPVPLRNNGPHSQPCRRRNGCRAARILRSDDGH